MEEEEEEEKEEEEEGEQVGGRGSEGAIIPETS